MNTASTAVRYQIVRSNGSEIDKEGEYALYLCITDIGGPFTAVVFDGVTNDAATLDLDSAVALCESEYQVPRESWEIDLDGVRDSYGQAQEDPFDGVTIAEVSLCDSDLWAWPEADLYDADTGDKLGRATRGQVEASILAADKDGGAGIVLINEDGQVVGAGSYDAQQFGVRRVYTV